MAAVRGWQCHPRLVLLLLLLLGLSGALKWRLAKCKRFNERE